jgi:hypothetical protein
MKCDTCKMKRVCNELERMGKVPKHENCRCYSQTKPVTNADRIRAMTDEELAVWMSARDIDLDPKCPPTGPLCVNYNDCASCWLAWLKEEAFDG